MPVITVEEAQDHLKDIIAGLNPSEELVIVQDGEPVATLARTPSKRSPCRAGCYRKAEFWMAPDFDVPLEDFKDDTAPALPW